MAIQSNKIAPAKNWRWINRHWGKASPAVEGPGWHPLACHALDVAAVGRTYLAHHRRLLDWLTIEGGWPSASALIDWVTFWLVLHDLGKFSLSFQCQRLDLVEKLRGSLPPHSGSPDVRHDSLGYWLWLERIAPVVAMEFGWGTDANWQDGADHWARAFMGHHGQPPLEGPRRVGLHFAQEDTAAAEALVRWAADQFIDDQLRAALAAVDPDDFAERSRVCALWAAGLAVLADWIGSDTDHFPYVGTAVHDLGDYWGCLALPHANAALGACGVLPVNVPDSLAFSDLFPGIATPSPLQQWAIDLDVTSEPTIVLLEDVTGAGKTEAAVMLAHRTMAAGASDGFFIGLPSMATANAMYARIAGVFGKLFPYDASLALAHGSKNLVEDFARTVLRPGHELFDRAQGDDTASARCRAWLADHNKRALLAQAGVGTIDQSLLAALQSKHQSLRLIGLFGKTLVVDEVHACDAYMQRTLESLLMLHARGRGSAILLSATLPRRMKTALLSAYARGAGSQIASITSSDYPLATRWAPRWQTSQEVHIPTRSDVERRVEVRIVNETAVVMDLLVDAVRQGRCVAWIRNTVADLMSAHEALETRLPPDAVTLFHARFTLGDRLSIEERVLSRFGAASGPAERRGQVLLANQVAEQSLDVCVDVLVSDLAPLDRMLQRAGRLHRHPRAIDGTRLPAGASDERGTPVLWVLAPVFSDAPGPRWYSDVFPKAAFVYPDFAQLWRTLKELARGHYTVPTDVRPMIENVFDDEAGSPEGLQVSGDRAMGKAYGDRGVAQGNSITLATGYRRQGTEWMSDRSAPSRLGEDTEEILLARWCEDGVGALRIESWCERRAHAWEYSTVRVPTRLIQEAVAPEDEHRRAVIDAARARLPNAGRHVVLLVLHPEGDGGWADAVAASGQRRRWTYHPRQGLLAVVAPSAGESSYPAPASQA